MFRDREKERRDWIRSNLMKRTSPKTLVRLKIEREKEGREEKEKKSAGQNGGQNWGEGKTRVRGTRGESQSVIGR